VPSRQLWILRIPATAPIQATGAASPTAVPEELVHMRVVRRSPLDPNRLMGVPVAHPPRAVTAATVAG